MFELEISEQADEHLKNLRADRSIARRLKAVEKALRFLGQDPRHPALNTHVFKGEKCPHGDRLFEAYAENKTPGAYRIFFCYPPGRPRVITIVAITPHP